MMMSLKKTAKDKFGDESRWQELTQSMPFGRTIRPVEIGAMAALLVSDLSGYTNGEVVNIDGGGMYRQS
jgi:enoyl-[acyl-carrier-protein] reductase (NADH)